jgi:formylglycine-generating enzyme required for sulfatase activity
MKLPIRQLVIATTLALTLPATAQSCLGDVAFDGRIDGGDLGVMLANWGPVTTTALSRACDLDGSTVVDGADLGILLNAWGSCQIVVPTWATVIETQPNPAVVTDSVLRTAILRTGLPWRVRDQTTGMEMLLVPPGSFMMGCVVPLDPYECWWGELAAHRVTLTNPFYLARYELTQSEWEAAMGTDSNPSIYRGLPDSPVLPVERLSWESVQGYLGATGTRLPTEAEWEFACRAGSEAPLYSGATDESSLDSLAWCNWNCGGKTHVGGGKRANGFGFYDMLGNVFELVEDFWAPFSADAVTNPIGPETGLYRVVRGGAIEMGSPANMTSSARQAAAYPAVVLIGVRVAKNP